MALALDLITNALWLSNSLMDNQVRIFYQTFFLLLHLSSDIDQIVQVLTCSLPAHLHCFDAVNDNDNDKWLRLTTPTLGANLLCIG